MIIIRFLGFINDIRHICSCALYRNKVDESNLRPYSRPNLHNRKCSLTFGTFVFTLRVSVSNTDQCEEDIQNFK